MKGGKTACFVGNDGVVEFHPFGGFIIYLHFLFFFFFLSLQKKRGDF